MGHHLRYLQDGAGAVVGFQQPFVGRAQEKGLGIETRTETEVETCRKEAARQFRLAPEAVNDTGAASRMHGLEAKEFVPCPDAMDDKRFAHVASPLHLQFHVMDLGRERNGAALVDATLADAVEYVLTGQHLDAAPCLLPVAVIEGVDACRIDVARNGAKGVRRKDVLHRHVDNCRAWLGGKVVGMDVKNGGHALCRMSWTTFQMFSTVTSSTFSLVEWGHTIRGPMQAISMPGYLRT